MAKAKKAAPKKAAKKTAKKAAKPKMLKRTVGGKSVTVEVKPKNAKKDAKGCTRIDIGGNRVAEVCVHTPKRAKAGSKPKAMTEAQLDAAYGGRSDSYSRGRDIKPLSASEEEELFTKYSGAVRGKRKSKKGRRKAKGRSRR